MTDENQTPAEDRAADTDTDPEVRPAEATADQDDDQEVLIDNVIAEGEDDPDPARDDQQ